MHYRLLLLLGDIAWRLYDTYGFPVDLTQLMAEERNVKIDMIGYNRAKQEAQVSYSSVEITLYVCLQYLARGTGGGVDETVNLDVHAINELKTKGLPPTNDLPKYNYSFDDGGNYG